MGQMNNGVCLWFWLMQHALLAFLLLILCVRGVILKRLSGFSLLPTLLEGAAVAELRAVALFYL